MKKVIALLVILTIVLSGYTLRAAEDTIVICSSSEQFRNDYIQEALRAKFPQYNIVVMYMSTGKAARQGSRRKGKNRYRYSGWAGNRLSVQNPGFPGGHQRAQSDRLSAGTYA